MKKVCRDSVNQAAGRTLSDAEIKGIDERMDATMRRLSRNPDWRGLSANDRVMLAAQTAMQDMQAQAARKVANAQRQIVATVATNGRISELQGAILGGTGRRGDAQIADIANTRNYIDGIKSESISRLRALIDANTSGEGVSTSRRALMFLLDAENPRMTRDLVNEIFGNADGRSSNAVAKQAAKAWLDEIEVLRQRFNTAGGDVGKLDYGYLAQAHNPIKLREVGATQWAKSILPLLDRSRYTDASGRQLSDVEMAKILEDAHETIASDGAADKVPGQMTGSGAVANRGGDSRSLHFKDGDSYLAYMGQFGKDSVYGAMMSHIGGAAKNIGLVERYGPNPEAQFRLQTDQSKLDDGGSLTRSFGNTQEAYWAILTGKHSQPDSDVVAQRMARIGQVARNVQTFGKLQGAVLSSITDVATMVTTTGFNKLSYWELLRNVGKGVANAEHREFAQTHALVAESLSGGINRWAGEHLSNDWSGRVTNATMRLSFMNAWTDTMRSAFAMTMMHGMGSLSRKTWAQLSAYDKNLLIKKGINEADWSVVNRATPTVKDGRNYLTPESIYATGDANARQISAKITGLIKDESEFAVINPDMAAQAVQTFGGLKAGSAGGEFARLMMQFKSFPATMISRHWRRMLDSGGKLEGAPAIANPFVYGAAMLLSTTALGAIAYQAKQIAGGKDPINMDPTEDTGRKFWTQAMMQGGGMSFMGDILLKDTTADRSSLDTLSRTFMGPTFGTAADAFELTKGNIDELRAGKDPQAGAEAIRFARSHTPLVNLWYSKAALDHMFVHAMQENLNPGYLGRMRGRARKEWDQDSWLLEGRTPDLTRVIGEE